MKNCFPYFSTKIAKIQKMSLASENTLETEYFMPLNHFSNFSNFRGTQHFMWFWGTFLNAKTRGVAGWIWHFQAVGFDGDVQNCVLVEFGVGNTSKKWWGLNKTSRFLGFFFCFFSEFQGISCFPIEKYLVLRSYIMRNIVPHNIEEMSGNSICQESPGKHPGNTRERSIY